MEEYYSDTFTEVKALSKQREITRVKEHCGEVSIPNGIRVSVNQPNILVVKGPLGEVSKDFSKVPVEFRVSEGKITYKIYWKGRKGYSLINTISAIIKNMFTGVTKGYTYKMKVHYKHFPISVEVRGREVWIKNFLGERGVRKARIIGDTRVFVKGDTVIVTGLSKEDVGLTAANIQAACKIKNMDPRVFMDGIYVYSKEEGLTHG